MKYIKAWNVGILGAVLASVLLSGCTIKMAVRRTSTKFVYPNSNVSPLGRVKAKSPQSFSIFVPKFFDAKQIDELSAQALSQKGGDILVNPKIVVKTILVPIMLPFMFSSMEIEGTAAKMVIGKQELH